MESYRNLEIPSEILKNWQGLIEHIADISSVPTSLIMRLSSDTIDVCVTNQHQDNPFCIGDQESLNANLLCKEVIRSQQPLIIENALKTSRWCDNPDAKLGLISYCGLPVNWPTGKPFGTICILDNKENGYTDSDLQLLKLFKQMVENSLTILYQQYVLEEKVTQRTAELEVVNNQLAKALDKYAAAEQVIQHQKYRNGLTGLPNIHELEKYFNEHILISENKTALMHLRITNLTQIRNNLGLLCSQHITCYVADKLKSLCPEGVYLALLSDDDFALVYQQENENLIVTLMEAINSLLAEFSETVSFQHHYINLTRCIGISYYPEHGNSFLELMHNTSVAASECQTHNRDYQFFDVSLKAELMDRFQLESQLMHALVNEELSLHYQPLFDVQNEKLIGSEALLRWHNPLLGSVGPDTFIPIAEESGMMIEIGYFVLRSAIKQLASWQRSYDDDFFVAVNLSPLQLTDLTLVDKIETLLKTYNVSAKSLEVEITENVFMDDQEVILNVLKRIDALGIRIALDDFGTGYSSLSYIHRFPFSIVKIDRSFIASLETSVVNQHLVTAIISMAKAFNLTVVAEGIEDKEQANFIQRAGGHVYQGYHFGRPMSVGAFSRQYMHNSLNSSLNSSSNKINN
ncbi:GGDEF and EAL domain-containing protein [Moritella sp. 24]|uniref:bifunctional diguanylate cyclase/phosphodiesterase n=1 Tax=Moritella sp. 24 TaxID=2746230 RepID=UPI001BADEA8C|nr:EAL domain-containing protein [Moritella sp. 24]QUM77165.1 GGDEF and EAL domain-containing protein [Moritella sp. 24]